MFVSWCVLCVCIKGGVLIGDFGEIVYVNNLGGGGQKKIVFVNNEQPLVV